MEFLRTPDSQFTALPGYDFEPHYLHVDDTEGGQLRLHYLDISPPENAPPSGETVLMLHGEPSWCYLYRKMIPIVSAAGHRIIAPDLIGFGRSDKPTQVEDYTYQRHLDWLREVILQLDLSHITLMCQDWGGLLGLRLVADHPERFARVCAANTMLLTGDIAPGEAFAKWKAFAQTVPEFPAGGIIKGATVNPLPDAVIAAYNAPYPDESYKAGARQFPNLVPVTPDDPASDACRRAWQVLESFDKPFLTAFSDSDPVTAGGDKVIQSRIPGCQGQAHTTIENAGHFLQEDSGEALAKVLVDFIQHT